MPLTAGNLWANHWWAMALRGVAAILFGAAVIAYPVGTISALIFFFGSYCVADAVLSFVSSIRRFNNGEAWGTPLVLGLVSVAAGVAAWTWPAATALTLLYIIGAWAFVRGFFEMVGSFVLPLSGAGRIWLALAGLFSVALGLLMFLSPGTGALALITVISAYAIAYGVCLIALSITAKRFRAALAPTSAAEEEFPHRRRPAA